MNPCELTMSITAVANCIASQLDDDELDLAAAFFSQLGDTLGTIGAWRAVCCKKDDEEDCQKADDERT